MKRLILLYIFLLVPLRAEMDFLGLEYQLRTILKTERDSKPIEGSYFLHGFNPPYVTVEGEGPDTVRKSREEQVIGIYRIRTELVSRDENSINVLLKGKLTGLIADAAFESFEEENYGFEILVLLDEKFYLQEHEVLKKTFPTSSEADPSSLFIMRFLLDRIPSLVFLKKTDIPKGKFSVVDSIPLVERFEREFKGRSHWHNKNLEDHYFRSDDPDDYFEQDNFVLYQHLYHPRVMQSEFSELGILRDHGNLRFQANFFLRIDQDHFLHEMEKSGLHIEVPNSFDPALTLEEVQKFTYRTGVFPVAEGKSLEWLRENLDFIEEGFKEED